MNAKQRHTLQAIFERPTGSDVPWNDVERLLLSLGADVTEGGGSRVRVALKGMRAVFHRPHPARIVDRGQLATFRTFLQNAGIHP